MIIDHLKKNHVGHSKGIKKKKTKCVVPVWSSLPICHQLSDHWTREAKVFCVKVID